MSASEQIDQLIAAIADWRGPVFAKVRNVFLAADPEIVEDFKWRGTPVWYRDGMIGVANAHKGKVKVTFHSGAFLEDPDGIFNADLEGGKWRAIDIFEGDKLDETALKAMIRRAIAYNQAHLKKNAKKKPA